jgi:hypothetical protein
VNSKATTVRFTAEDLQILADLRKATGLGNSDVIRLALRQAIGIIQQPKRARR